MEFLNSLPFLLIILGGTILDLGQTACVKHREECKKDGKRLGPCCEKLDSCQKVTFEYRGSHGLTRGTIYKCIPKDCDALECETANDCCTKEDRTFPSNKAYHTQAICEPVGDSGKKICTYCMRDGEDCYYYGCCSSREPSKRIYCLQFTSPKNPKVLKHFCGKQCSIYDKPEKTCEDVDGYQSGKPNFYFCNSTHAISCVKRNNALNREVCGLQGSDCKDNEPNVSCCMGYSCQNGKCKRNCVSEGEQTIPGTDTCNSDNCCSLKNGRKSKSCLTKDRHTDQFNRCHY